MNTNQKKLKLIGYGLRPSTLENLTESQVNLLFGKLQEQVTPVSEPVKTGYKVGDKGGNLPATPKGYNVKKNPDGTFMATPNEQDDTLNVVQDPDASVDGMGMMEEKYKLFEDTMFHIAIENTINVNYISEKIIDCFMSYTIPIYWGCPNIGEYFNTDGIIFFETKEQLNNILDNLTEKDYYDRLEAVLENYEIANKKYAFYSDRVNEVLDKLTKK